MSNTTDLQQPCSAIWLTWETQVRNRSMASALGIPIYELVSHQPRWIKFPWFILKTLAIVIKSRARVVFAQNPSLLLSLLVTLIGMFSRKIIVVDAHNAGLYPLDGKYKLLNAIAKFIIRNADLIIVSNSYLAEIVEDWGGKGFVMPDPLPDLSNESAHLDVGSTKLSLKENYFFFICMWMDDEPYGEVISAAKLIPSELNIYISGNFKKRLSDEQVTNLPKNIKLLGFVSEEDYIAYLSHAVAAIDLTTRDHCLVCGAYESIALGTPCVISESKINREIFSKGFVYTKNDALSIGQALIQANSRRAELMGEMTIKKLEHNQDIAQKVEKLKIYLSMPASL